MTDRPLACDPMIRAYLPEALPAVLVPLHSILGAHGGLWYWQADSHELHLPAATCEQLGLDQQCQQSFSTLFTPQARPHLLQMLSALWQGQPAQAQTYQLLTGLNQQPQTLELSGSLIADAAGNHLLAGLIRLPPASAGINSQLKLMHEWIQLVPQGIALVQYPEGTIVECNRVICEILDWPLDQVIGRNSRELKLWVNEQQRTELISQARSSEAPVSCEATFRRRDGNLIEILISIRYLLLDGQERLILTMLDNTETKRTEAALRSSEEKFARAFRLTPDAVVITDKQSGRLIETNAGFEQRFGWKASEVIGRSVFDLGLWVNKDDRHRLIEAIGNKTGNHVEALARASDGSISLNLVYGDEFILHGKPALVLSIRDIGQQREQELLIKESQERLSQAMEAAQLGFWDMQLNPLHFFASARGAALHGLPEQPLHGSMRQYMQHVTPADQQRIEQFFKDFISGKLTELQTIYSIQLPDGQLRYLESNSKLYRTADGQQQRVTGIVRDITERIEHEQKLKASEEKFTALFQASMEPCCVTRPEDGQFLEINQSFSETFGWTPAEIIGKPPGAFNFWVIPEQREEIAEVILQQGFIRNYPIQFRHKRGHTLQCLTSVRLLHVGAETVLTSSIQDITAQLEAEAALRASQDKFAKAFHTSPDAISITDLNTTRYLDINEGFTRISGYTAREILGHSYLDIGIWSTTEKLSKLQELLRKDGRVRNQEVQGRRKNGSLLSLSVSMEPFELDGSPCMLTTSRDISDLKAAEARIEHMAYHDPLTNLPNRSLLTDRLEQQIPLFRRHDLQGALLFLDLDHFKTINDSLGHAAGDAILKMVTARLESAVRTEDTVARLGGDEFVVLLNALDGHSAGAALHALALAEKLRALLAEPMLFAGHQLHITPSIGVAMIPEHGENPADLLKHADIALYRAKDAGRNVIKLFEDSMLEDATERLRLENDLRQALVEGQFELHYQPQVDARDGRIIGAEALLRWEHPTLGKQSPAQFIRVLDESGQIVAVGNWVLTEACRTCAVLLQNQLVDPQHFSMAVNISARQFAQANFTDSIFNALNEAGVPPMMLKLEVTESIVIKDMESTIAKMQLLQEGGVNFAMDDFGTGYSSLTYLKRLPIDVLKIDQSFIRDSTRDPNDAEIIRAIVAMALSLKLQVIAEGVEHQDQLDFLVQENCHIYQGYLFSKPIVFAEFRQLLGNL